MTRPKPKSKAVGFARALASSGAGRALRINAGMSLAQMSRDVGIGEATLYRAENGKNPFPARAAERYIQLCGVLAATADHDRLCDLGADDEGGAS